LLLPPRTQLELVLLVSTMASDDKCCQQLASSNIISLLYQLWKEKSEDAEVVLQLIHCFHKLMQNEASREEALYRCVRSLLTPSDPSFLSAYTTRQWMIAAPRHSHDTRLPCVPSVTRPVAVCGDVAARASWWTSSSAWATAAPPCARLPTAPPSWCVS